MGYLRLEGVSSPDSIIERISTEKVFKVGIGPRHAFEKTRLTPELRLWQAVCPRFVLSCQLKGAD